MREVQDGNSAVAANGKAAYTVIEFCAAFGISRSLAYEEVAAGRLPTRKVGTKTLIRAIDAHAWLDSLPAGGTQ